MREEFSKKVKDNIQKRASFICSNPDCRVLTLAPSEINESKIIFTGIAAHICAASANGPRYEVNMLKEERTSINNAIFLCSNCAIMIDKNNGVDFSKDLLKEWKRTHENWVRRNLNKSFNQKNSLHSVNFVNYGQGSGIFANSVTLNNHDQFQSENPKLSHDIQLFRGGEEYLSEKFVSQIDDYMDTYTEISFDEYNRLVGFFKYFEPVSNEYINEKVEQTKKSLISEINQALWFINNEYDMDRKSRYFIGKPFESKREVVRPIREITFFDKILSRDIPTERKIEVNKLRERQSWYGDLNERYADYRRCVKKNLFI